MVASTTPSILTPNALEVIHKRPYVQDGETPDEMFRRVSLEIARPELENPMIIEKYGEDAVRENHGNFADSIYNLISGLYFLPNTPTLVHAGVPIIEKPDEESKGWCLSACFVDSPDDNLDSITSVGYEIPHIERAGGGIGWGLSKLRPKNDKLGEKDSGACGPVMVLHWYAQGGRTFTQGSTRPGAHMAQLSISHPDILEFIHVKDNCLSPHDPLANVNISVQIPDAFMDAIAVDGVWTLVNPRTGLPR